MSDPGFDTIENMMEKHNLSDSLKNDIRDCVKFHTFPAGGLLISVFMVDLALENLGAGRGEKLYAVCETHKCAPDPLQVLVHCTYGNHRLRVINTGRFAMTVNRYSPGDRAEGIRVYVDPEKVRAYPVLNAWFNNVKDKKIKADMEDLLDEIIKAGRNILSWERVNVHVTSKPKWDSARCAKCGETVPENTLIGGVCLGCGKLKYYDDIPAGASDQ